MARKRSKLSKAIDWLRARRDDSILITALLCITFAVSVPNITGNPQRFEDEGTYISQAWAIKEQNTLAHYTYWYDHPPAGWIQIAGYLTITDALDRYASAITAGREFMIILHLISVALLYIFARRMRIGPAASAIGVGAYALSPLVVEFSRYVLLDNVALPWLLGAFVLAMSPKSRIRNIVLSGICMAIAILSKETLLALLPVLLYAIWKYSDKRNRRYALTAFGVVFISVSGLYLLYAALKNELFPGQGHVSLLGTFYWQLLGREGSGSIFDATSNNRGLINYWLNIDFWLMLAGTLSLPVALYIKRFRIAGFSLLIGLMLLFRSGYLPYPYIIALLPFAALTFAGLLDQLIIRPAMNMNISPTKQLHAFASGIAIAAIVISVIAPNWYAFHQISISKDLDRSSRRAVDWIANNVPKQKRMVVESALWTDLQTQGFSQPEPVWLYKTETDPAIVAEIGGWRGIDYVALNGPTIGSSSFDSSFPTVAKSLENSEIVKEFGQDNQKILIFKVNHQTISRESTQ